MVTDVYVSIDGLIYNQLDLLKDETIVMKYSSKDLQDITKIFSPYSQDFTFEASKNNRRYLGFFGDTDVIKIKTDSKYFCKIYVGGQLFQFGFLRLKDVKYQNNKPQTFTASFATSVTNLKDRLGNDTLQQLTDNALIDWNRNKVSDLISGTETINFDGIDTKVYVPLISNNRVWQFSDSSSDLDNIKFGLGNIVSSELRPALDFNSILEFIKKKYNLLIELPIATQPQFSKAFMWCNSEELNNTNTVKLNCNNPMLTTYTNFPVEGNNWNLTIPSQIKYSITQSANTFKIIKNTLAISADWLNYCIFNVNITNLQNIAYSGQNKVDIFLVDKSTNLTIATNTIDYEIGNFNVPIVVNDSLFVTDEIEFYVYMQFSNPISFDYSRTNLQLLYRKTAGWVRIFYDFFQDENGNTYFNSNTSFAKINLFRALPNLKVIDFLTSLIKTFNLSIYDSSPDNENLFFLTPENINETNKVYSKLEVDYTPYLDSKEHSKSAVEQYNYYNLKHATSKYMSNVDFKRIYNEEYGQVFYPTIKPRDAKEFKVETNFSIIPPVQVSEFITAYGFTSDAPTIISSGAKRYKPNYNEPAIFYNNGIQTTSVNYGFEAGATAPVVISKNTYQLSLPFLTSGNYESFGFSELVLNDLVFDNSIYKRFYAEQLSRLVNPNVMSQYFTFNLPINELYLNEFTENLTPTGFRLQNDVINMENRFTILDATIDITTGKAKINLLNY